MVGMQDKCSLKLLSVPSKNRSGHAHTPFWDLIFFTQRPVGELSLLIRSHLINPVSLLLRVPLHRYARWGVRREESGEEGAARGLQRLL